MSKSADLKARKTAAVPNGVGTKGIYVARAENSEVWDVDGRRYIDFAAGIGVLNTGHRHPRIMAAVAEQAECFAHTCFHVALVRVLRAPCRAAECARSGGLRKEDVVFVLGRRGSRERGEDRALSHQALGSYRLLRRFPRPHPHDDGAYRQSDALQAWLRPVSCRDLPCRISVALSRHHDRAGACSIWSGCSTATSIRRRWQPSSSSPCRARAVSTSRPSISYGRCGACATSTGSC